LPESTKDSSDEAFGRIATEAGSLLVAMDRFKNRGFLACPNQVVKLFVPSSFVLSDELRGLIFPLQVCSPVARLTKIVPTQFKPCQIFT
jgi:hypothetical protein